MCLGVTGSAPVPLSLSGLWLSAFVPRASIPVSEGVPYCAGPSDPKCLCLRVETTTLCMFSVCAVFHCLLFLESVQLVSNGGRNHTHSHLACDFCLDKSACCDGIYPQQTRVKVLGCHSLSPEALQ